MKNVMVVDVCRHVFVSMINVNISALRRSITHTKIKKGTTRFRCLVIEKRDIVVNYETTTIFVVWFPNILSPETWDLITEMAGTISVLLLRRTQ